MQSVEMVLDLLSQRDGALTASFSRPFSLLDHAGEEVVLLLPPAVDALVGGIDFLWPWPVS